MTSAQQKPEQRLKFDLVVSLKKEGQPLIEG
jgi:hypothetical protein